MPKNAKKIMKHLRKSSLIIFGIVLVGIFWFGPAFAASKYWVGGGGNWSDPTHHWATSDNGSPGAGNLPAVGDTVFFNAHAGTGIVTVDTATVSVADFTTTGSTITAFTINSGVNFTSTGTMLIISGATVTNNGNATVASLTNTGAWTQGNNSTLKYTGGTAPAPTLTATATGNTVDYAANAATTVVGTTYYNLQIGVGAALNAARTYTLGAAATVTNVLTIGQTSNAYIATFSPGTYTLTLSGTNASVGGALVVINYYNGTATGTFSTSAGTVDFTGDGATTIPAVSYFNLQVGNAAGLGTDTYTLGGNTTVWGVLTIGYGSGNVETLADGGYNLTISGTGTPFVISNGAYSPTGTMTYNGLGSTNVTSTTYNNLTINQSGRTYTLAGAITCNGNLSILNGTLNTGSSYGITIGGNFIITGYPSSYFTPNSGTVTFPSGNHTLNFSGGYSCTYNPFYALTINSGGIVDVSPDNGVTSSNICLNGVFTNNGTFYARGGTHTFNNNFTNANTIYSGTSSITIATAPGVSPQITTGGAVFNNLTLSSGYSGPSLGFLDNVNVSGNLTLTGFGNTYPTGTIAFNVGGNFTQSGTYFPTSGVINMTLNGSSNQTISSVGNFNASLTVATSGGSAMLGGNFTFSSFLTINSGSTLDTSPNNGTTNYNITTNGVFTNNGTFKARGGSHIIYGNFTNAGTFNAGASTVAITVSASANPQVTAGGAAFNNLILGGAASGHAMTLLDNITVKGNLTIGNGGGTYIYTSNSPTIYLGGNFIESGGYFPFTNNTLNLVFNGFANQTINQTVGTFNTNLTIAKSSGSAILATNFQIASGSLTINSGNTFDTSPDRGRTNYNLTMGSAFATLASFTNNGRFYARGGSHTFYTTFVNAGTFDAAIGSTATFSDSNSNSYHITTGGANFSNVTFSMAGYLITLNDDMNINGNLLLSGNANIAASTTQNINLGGNYTQGNNGKFGFSGTLNLNLNGSANQTLTSAGGFFQANLTIAKSGGSAMLNSNLLVTSHNVTVNSGSTFDASPDGGTTSYNLSFGINGSQGTFTNNGTFNARGGSHTFDSTFINAGTINAGTGTVTFSDGNSNSYHITTGGARFNNVTFNFAGYILTLNDDININGNLSTTGSTSHIAASTTQNINLGGNYTQNSSGTLVSSGTLNLNLTGSTNQTLTLSAGTFNANLIIAKSGGSAILGGAFTVTTGTTTINSGSTLNLAGYTFASASGFTNNGTFQFTGDETTTAPTLGAGSTVVYTATTSSRAIKAWSYKNLTINGSGGTFTLPSAATATGNFTILAGTFDVTSSNYALNIGGNFSNSGTFTQRAGTVNLNGTNQKILGTTTFYNLTKDISSASADTLMFQNGNTQAVAASGTLTFKGASGKILTLRSCDANGNETDETPWNISVSNTGTTVTVQYVNVKDSNATTKAIATINSIDSQNNTNWTGLGPSTLLKIRTLFRLKTPLKIK